MTLIELLIVVVILGILAAIVIPTVSHARQEAAVKSTAVTLRLYAESCMRYHQDHEAWPPNVAGGHGFPPELDPYISKAERYVDTPVGGIWAYHNYLAVNPGRTVGGREYSVAVNVNNGDVDLYDEIDAVLDDGDVSTGIVQQVDRYGSHLNWVLE